MITVRQGYSEDFPFYYAHKCEREDIFWNCFKSCPDEEELRKVFLSRSRELDISVEGKVIYTICDDVYLGYIQFTVNNDDIEIGIGVIENSKGKGVGREAILLAIDLLKEQNCGKIIFARIREDNKKSIGCFLASGFIKTDKIEIVLDSDDKERQLIRYEYQL